MNKSSPKPWPKFCRTLAYRVVGSSTVRLAGRVRNGSPTGLDHVEGRIRCRALFRRHRANPLGPICAHRIRLVDARQHRNGSPARVRTAPDRPARGPAIECRCDPSSERDGFRPRRPRVDVPCALVLDCVRLCGVLRVSCARAGPLDKQTVACAQHGFRRAEFIRPPRSSWRCVRINSQEPPFPQNDAV